MDDSPKESGWDLERFRKYFVSWLRFSLTPVCGANSIPPTLCSRRCWSAPSGRHQFPSEDSAARQPGCGRYSHNMANAVRDLKRDKRDVRRERSLEVAIEESSARMEAWLAAEQLSPSEQAEKNEQLLRLAEALDQLPADQQEAVVLHHLQHHSLSELAEHFGRSPAAVAGLLHRGIRLQELLRDLE